MAMAYCKTCGAVGNFTLCPGRLEPDEMEFNVRHVVVFDEPTNNTTKGKGDGVKRAPAKRGTIWKN